MGEGRTEPKGALVVDVAGVYEAYARDLGVEVGELSKADKQQAMLDALLERMKPGDDDGQVD